MEQGGEWGINMHITAAVRIIIRNGGAVEAYTETGMRAGHEEQAGRNK